MLRLTCIAAALPLLAAVPAAAQGVNGGLGSKGFSPITGVGPKPVQREQPPPGLPGAQPRNSSAPADVPLDVPPTEALFDAINRGDMTSAREALNRGADLDGRNVLGMTPLDLSVDLSRNDITFLLLSMRSQASISGPPPVAPPPTPLRGSKKSTTEAKVASRRVPPQVVTVTAGQASPVRYAAVPALPVPQAGFLGFGAATSTP